MLVVHFHVASCQVFFPSTHSDHELYQCRRLKHKSEALPEVRQEDASAVLPACAPQPLPAASRLMQGKQLCHSSIPLGADVS